MTTRELENSMRPRRLPFPKRFFQAILLLAVFSSLCLFFYTNILKNRLSDMEGKIEPSQYKATGLIGGRHLNGMNGQIQNNVSNTLKGTFEYLKRSGQLNTLNPQSLNNTWKTRRNILFFNRCPKVGSQTLTMLLRYLHRLNHNQVVLSGKYTERRLNVLEERQQAIEILRSVPGTVYVDHVYYINFKQLKLPQPIYINLVRDPVERAISWFFYTRKTSRNAVLKQLDPPTKSPEWYKKNFNECVRKSDPECQYLSLTTNEAFFYNKRQVSYFCGHHPNCIPFNSPIAVQIAKEHVERDYAVVGSWEDTNVTLTVLEHYIPRFFWRARMVYIIHSGRLSNLNKNHQKAKVDDDVKEMIRKNFTHEYDFYYFCKRRLYKQYLAINQRQPRKMGVF